MYLLYYSPNNTNNPKLINMILSSRQVLLISAQEHREFFMFDPKTTAVMHKYHTIEHLASPQYYPHAQQIIAQQTNKTFLSLFNWDSQEVELKISMTESMTVLRFSTDGHYLYGGSQTGTVYLWEMPSGILLKKKNMHTGAIVAIVPYSNNHVISASKTEVKIWSLSSLLIEEDNSPALKQYTSVLDILAVSLSRNVIAVLTHKNLTLFNGSLTSQPKQLQMYQKIDYEYATTLATSNTKAFVGDGKGNIELVDLLPQKEDQLQLHFKEQAGQLEISHAKKRKILSGSKHPVTSLVYVETLTYVVAGHASGQVVIWHNYEIKKSLHLFKTAINSMIVLTKPTDGKIYQSRKIKALHKYELTKDQEVVELIPAEITAEDREPCLSFEGINQEEQILVNMLTTLRKPQKLLRQQLGHLRQERSKLIEANLHYFKMLAP